MLNKIASFSMRLGALISFITTNFVGGLVGAVVFWNISTKLVGEKHLFVPNSELGVFVVLSFTVCFFATAYVVGDTRFANMMFYNIDRWTKSRKLHLVKWLNNGIIGVARQRDFSNTHQMFWRDVEAGRREKPVGIVYYDIPNTMTFSDKEEHRGKVTGTMGDLSRLEEGCLIDWRPITVPGTSTSSYDIPPVPLQELIHCKKILTDMEREDQFADTWNSICFLLFFIIYGLMKIYIPDTRSVIQLHLISAGMATAGIWMVGIVITMVRRRQK